MEHRGGAVSFRTDDGIELPAVTAEKIREVDRVALDEFGLGILQMMENAGRVLRGRHRDSARGVQEALHRSATVLPRAIQRSRVPHRMKR